MIISLIIIFTVCYLINNFSYGDGSKSYREVARLPWKTIRDLYRVNPKRWRYEKVVPKEYDYTYGASKVLLYNSGDSWSKTGWGEYYNNSYAIVRVKMSPLTWFIFQWHRILGIGHTKGEQMILETAQKDIDSVRKQAQQQIEQANKMMEDIQKRLKEG